MRCYIPPADWRSDELLLPAEEAHHIRTVLRARVGSAIVAFDGCGRSADCEIVELDRHLARARILQQYQRPKSSPEVTLLQGIPREQKMDILIQKATELGVHRIRPVQTDHAVARVHEGNEDAKRERWQRIALNAAKQCGTAWLPEVEAAQPLLTCLTEMPRVDLLLVCSLEPDAQPLKSVLRAAREARPASVAILVGPEGDFSARERSAARNAGGRAVSLGQRTLRTETASLFILSVLDYEFSDPAPAAE
ncbi:MAG: 16S rRNA (uracil(1498)-N(3))-methyltransferase [Verrucomicrobia bacterium]|nr:16S rRNA (uracil(1498)-N(3))-methyltransferase [Kiritimatiellia bacterium]MCO6399976.1 16S rRNA (uracil(1498)-N(3))-methyltransferase [Verrucomicrobiota bacterium]